MVYPFEDLGDEQFERLVVEICKRLFGAGVQGFAAGRDGGRDARFHGLAERFPSAARGWDGITVIQAKHTNGYNTHFSDPNFSGSSDSAVLTEELPKVQALVEAGELDNYLLFANRRLGAVTHAELVKRISGECRVPKESIHLCGVEGLDDWIREFPGVVRSARIDPLDAPLILSSQDLAEVVLALAQALDLAAEVIDDLPVARTSYADKNRINNMSPAFAAALQQRYLHDTAQIGAFLADPGNGEYLAVYEAAVDEFQLKIIPKRHSYQSFDDVFNYLLELLFARDGVLRARKRLTRSLLFYMYWHCDIGETEDAPAN